MFWLKKVLLFFCLLALGFTSNAQNAVKFRIKNAGFTVPGYFSSFKPYVSWDKSNPSAAKFSGTVDVNTVNTSNSARDKHLKASDFFDVAKYPSMKFESTSVTSVSSDRIKITGKLTIKDVTKKVKFDVTYNGQAKSPWGQTAAGFKATSSINRFDYGLTWSKALEAGGLLVGDIVNITLKLELIKQ